MAGKLCFGAAINNAANVSTSKAFCEGRTHRAKGTAAAFPITDNPHVSGEDKTAWDLGWTDAHAGVGTYVGVTGCCAALGDVLV